MTNEEARQLALRFIDTWPGHVIKAHVWTEAIKHLDYQTAIGVYEHLRDHDEKPPAIARFIATYNSVTPSYGWPTPAGSDEPDVTPEAGRRIARAAYIEQCLSQGRTPNFAWFDRIIGLANARQRHPSGTMTDR